MTSYFGKLFIQRSPKAVDNYTKWLANTIRKAGLDQSDDRIKDIQFGKQDLPKVKLPREYSAVMPSVTKFVTRDKTFYFEYAKRDIAFTPEAVKKAEKNGMVVCGSTAARNLLTMDEGGNIYEIVDGKPVVLGPFLEVIGGNWGKVPMDYAEVMIFGKRVPLALILGYYQGLRKTLRDIKAKYRTEPSNQRSTAAPDEFMIQFEDERLYIKDNDPEVVMLMQGLARGNKHNRIFKIADYERPDVYGPLMAEYGITQSHIRELDLINDLFLDPITIDILKEMKEPTELLPLFYRCVSLITSDEAPDEADRAFMRRRGLERVSGMVYKAMVGAMREQRNKPNPTQHPVYMGPRDVWMQVNADPTVQLVKQLNPMHAIKEQAAVSMSGEGGRSAVSLVKKSRVFHHSDIGQIAESTPDSGKVGIRTYMPANPKISNLYGMTGEFDFEEDGSTSVLSTTGLTMPAINHDDGKRANLADVQKSAMVPAAGYVATPCRTGYEEIIGSRVGDTYAISAPAAGKVVKVTDTVIQVEYVDGKKQGWELGVVHGDSEGEAVPHNIITDILAGKEFEAGHVLAWNEAFFERSLTAPENVTMKIGAMAYTALLENNDTLEDGSRIDADLSASLTTRISKRKGILVNHDQVITNLVKVGDVLEYDSTLCQIQEGTTAAINADAAALAALQKLSGSNPKAKFAGTVTRVEVFYMGEPETMSESIREIVETDNKRRAKLKRETNKDITTTGRVNRSTYIAGEKLIAGTVAIAVYIDADLDQGVGDKAVFCNQLKTIHGAKLIGENRTKVGVKLNALFGYRSVNDRIVNSPIMQGSINTTQIHAQNVFANMVLGE